MPPIMGRQGISVAKQAVKIIIIMTVIAMFKTGDEAIMKTLFM